MNLITVITLNTNGDKMETTKTVDDLIFAWNHENDIPTNDDIIVECMLGTTKLYFDTFGSLMYALTGK